MAHDAEQGRHGRVDGIKFTLTDAYHSSSTRTTVRTWASRAASSSSSRTASRSTSPATRASSATWQLIGRIYSPDVAVLPIGDHFTMEPKEAAVALELLGTKRCVPCHFGTFPLLTGTPQELKELAPDVDVAEIEPGDTVEL